MHAWFVYNEGVNYTKVQAMAFKDIVFMFVS